MVELLRPYDLMKLLTVLGIQECEIQELERDLAANDEDLRAMGVFQTWRKANGSRATRIAILDALRRCNNVEAEEELAEKWREKGNFVNYFTHTKKSSLLLVVLRGPFGS